MDPIYLDYNATTPVADEVVEAMRPFLEQRFGNPSSSHAYGVVTRRATERAREQVAALLGCPAEDVVFTSGGTESNNYAIKGAALAAARRGGGRHVVTSAIEHPAVLEVCRWLESQGFRLSVLGVDEHGLVAPAELERCIGDDTALVTMMHANNEIGTIQPIAELASIAHAHGALMHTDAAQSLGKIPVDVVALEVDLLSVAGHKLYAPKGVGALYARAGVELETLMHGAGHEGGRRAGTENVLEIVGLGEACALARRDLEALGPGLRELRDRLHQALRAALGEADVRLNGHPERRLPNTLSLSFRGVEANTLLSEVGDRVAASAGAACHADGVDVSTVLEALGVPLEWAMGTVRLSVGRHTTPGEVDEAASVVAEAVKRLRPGSAPSDVSATGDEAVKLTRYTHGLGCACKLRPQDLEQVLSSLPPVNDAAVLVGPETSDDAAVYRLDDDTALVQSVDFFTPVVDDPYEFGAIAAANSLSDLYAMGARPLFALSIVGFPSGRLPLSVLERILEGAGAKAAEAGIPIVGGHSVEDSEPKFGLAVTGAAHPGKLLRNSTARPGDALVLTKPLGLGIVATAVKRGQADVATAREASALMATLNRAAAEAVAGIGASACTDVTGFGLLGHLVEMLRGSGVDARLKADAVPSLEAAAPLARAGAVPGGTLGNLQHFGPNVDFDEKVPRITRLILADAQTSGGLLISLPEPDCERLVQELRSGGVEDAARIGTITGPGAGRVHVAMDGL